MKFLVGFLKYGLGPIATGVAATWISGEIFYDIGYDSGKDAGYDAGYRMGQNDGVADLWAATEEERREAEANFQESLRVREEAFEAELQNRDSEFEAELTDRVRREFGDELLEASEQRFREGRDQGYSEGTVAGRAEYEATCERRISEVMDYGRLWQEYTEKVYQFLQEDPRNSSEALSRARAIVSNALQGREALNGMAPQLNGDIDALNQAVQEEDVRRVRELIRTLGETLGTKGEVWRSNYRQLSAYESQR